MSVGKFLVTTRPAEKVAPLDSHLCVEVVNVPLTEISEVEFPQSEIDRIRKYDPEAVVFTSKRGAEIYFSEIDPHLNRGKRAYYGVGPSTCSSVTANGHDCTMPAKRDSQGLGELVSGREAGKRVLFFRSGQANRVLDEMLSAGNVQFINATAYNVVKIRKPETAPIMDPDCFGVVFTSSMEVESFIDAIGGSLGQLVGSGMKFFSIGKYTTLSMGKHSIPLSEPEGNSDIEQLLKEICRKYFG